MKKFAFLLLVFAGGFLGKAQDVQRVEGELYIGMTVPASKFHDGSLKLGPELGLEVRYNIPESKFDCGIMVDVSTAIYKLKLSAPDSDYSSVFEQSNRSVSYILNGDYNFGQGKKINPYAGLGIGLSINEPVTDVLYDYRGVNFAVRPRIGVELFRHLRVGLHCIINRRGYNAAAISVGAVIGGRPKR